MPKRKDNPIKPIGALFGERVLVQAHGKDFIVTSLKPRRRKKSSEEQKYRQTLFGMAVREAKGIIKDPKRKAAYERNLKGHRNAYQAALSECLKRKD